MIKKTGFKLGSNGKGTGNFLYSITDLILVRGFSEVLVAFLFYDICL